MNERQITYPIEDRWTYLWLAIGIVLSLVSVPIGKFGIPLAFWIGSVFFIRFMRTQRRWWLAALIIAAATFLTAYLAMPASLGIVRPTSAAGAAAYVHVGNPALMQLVAIIGMWAITFLVAWPFTSSSATCLVGWP